MACEYPEKNAQKIIIIQPGSLYLRMGRASDLNPQQVLHGIARRRTPNGLIHQDELLPTFPPLSREIFRKYDEIYQRIQMDFNERGGRRNISSSLHIPDDFSNRPIIQEPDKQCLFAEDLLLVRRGQDSKYNVHFPIKRGEFNLHDNVGGTVSSICQDLESIWTFVVEKKLKISLSSLPQYSAVLIVPDMHSPTYLKLLTSIVLKEMHFGSCMVIQESVAATFGAGLGYACVVDIGDQKTAISCVEDGVSQSKSRIKLDYGGGDVSQILSTIFFKNKKYQHMGLDFRIPRNALILKTVKEKFCRLDNEPDVNEYHIPPLGFFYTELFNSNGNQHKSLPVAQRIISGTTDPEDYIDADFVRDTGRKKEHLMDQFVMDGANLTVSENIIVDDMDVVDILEIDKDEFMIPQNDNIMGLDEAILTSIDRCLHDDIKRKMYSCILIVGGGVKTPGFGRCLRNRIYMQTPPHFRSDILDVLIGVKDMDPANTAWKGAAIMSCLDSASELWISEFEWKKYGLRVLREKSCFMW